MVTEETRPENGHRKLIHLLFFALCTILLFIGGLGKLHLSGDEVRVAGIAAEMARSKDMVVPRLNGEPFLEKPPLYFWVTSVAFNLLGENPFAARTPAALAAIGGVALVFFLARSMGFSLLSAIFSGLILATSTGYWSIGRNCVIDMVLCLCTTCAMLCFFRATRTLSKRYLWYSGFVISLSGAVLAKGLIGVAMPFSALCIWLIVEKESSFRAWGLLSLGSALCLIPAAIWIGFLYNDLGWNAVYEVTWLNNVGRFIGTHQLNAHIEPFYYYIVSFPKKFFPWVILLPFALIYHLREMRRQQTEKHALFFLIWLVIPFILLSISAGKRHLYLVPLYPPAALFVGTAIGKYLKNGKALTNWLYVPAFILSVSIILVSLGFFGMCIYFKQPFFVCFLVFLPGLCLGVLTWRQLSRKNMKNFFRMLAPAMAVLFLTFDIEIKPLTQRKKSYDKLFEYCEKLESEGSSVFLFRPSERLSGAYVFYMKRTTMPIKDTESLKKVLHGREKAVAISDKRNLMDLDNFDIIKIFKIGHRTLAFAEDKRGI